MHRILSVRPGREHGVDDSIPALCTLAVLHLNDREYLESRGLNVTLGQNHYPEGHLRGLVVVQHGRRVTSNADLRLERSPGQWSAVPRQGDRTIDRQTDEISVTLELPDPDKNRIGLNPVEYPDLELRYTLRVGPSKNGYLISVDLGHPLPDEWVGHVAFRLIRPTHAR
jgi:hypothetical protein